MKALLYIENIDDKDLYYENIPELLGNVKDEFDAIQPLSDLDMLQRYLYTIHRLFSTLRKINE